MRATVPLFVMLAAGCAKPTRPSPSERDSLPPCGEQCAQAACPPWQKLCGEACVDVQSSASNCGDCGATCDVPNAAASCVSGRCTVGQCAAGFANCDRDPGNGCEADLSSIKSCGICGNVCPPVAQGFVAACDEGVCGAQCAPGTVLCGDRCLSQCERWKWVNPTLSPNNLYTAAFTDAEVGLAGGDKQLLRTTNGGASWTEVSGNRLDHIEAMQFLTATRVVAIGFNLVPGSAQTAAQVSDDSGQTWRSLAVQTATGNMVFDLHFDGSKGATVGAAMGGNGLLLVTEDGGGSWVDRSPPNAKWLHGVHVRGQKLWAAGDSGLYVSEDLGQTWAAPVLSTAQGLRGVWMRDGLVGLAVGYGEEIFRTADGGASWARVNEGPHDNWLKRVRFADATRAIAVGFGGAVWTSSDAGQSWSLHTPYAGSYLFAVPTVGARAWAVGTRGVIFRSDDWGASWARQTPGYSAAFLRMSFPTPLRGYAVGELGGIVYSDDGGKTWGLCAGQYGPYAQANPSMGVLGNSLRAVTFIDGLEGWAVGDPVRSNGQTVLADSVILHTTDGGQTWTLQPSGTQASLRAVGFSSPLEGWAVGAKGTVLRTVNGGASWSSQPGLTSDLTDIAVLSDDEAWVSGHQLLAHTVDGGATWTRVNKALGILYSVRFVDALTGIAAGTAADLSCGFELTQDGGKSWTTVKTPFKEFAFAAQLAPDKLNGVAALVGGKILRTKDGGKTWLLDAYPTFLSLFDVQTAGQSFVVSGEMGGILRGPSY